jgi:hypothetical protein
MNELQKVQRTSNYTVTAYNRATSQEYELQP